MVQWKDEDYGKEIIIDLHECKLPVSRQDLKRFFKTLCKTIGMKREDLHFWDYQGFPKEYAKAPAHLKGRTAVQFISTSNITLHTVDELGKVYINLFSCKNFDPNTVEGFCERFFQGRVVQSQVWRRM